MAILSHYIDPSQVERGDHLYVLRVLGFYQHHGIAITGADACRLKPKPNNIEPIMVIEQNLEGLGVVTLEQFSYECRRFIKRNHNLRRVKYNENSFVYGIKRRGSCYIQKPLPREDIVENAISIYNKQKEEWSSYSVLKCNCEHFAFVCCTKKIAFSEQVMAVHDLSSNLATTALQIGIPFTFNAVKKFAMNVVRIGEKLTPSSIANLTFTSLDEFIKACLLGNGITAAAGFSFEFLVLTIRLIVYSCVKNNEKKRTAYLSAGWAIEPSQYTKCLVQAAAGNAVSFGMSILGLVVGAAIPLPGTTVAFSIVFGFIGYVIGRLFSGAAINKIQQLYVNKKEQKQLSFVKY